MRVSLWVCACEDSCVKHGAMTKGAEREDTSDYIHAVRNMSLLYTCAERASWL